MTVLQFLKMRWSDLDHDQVMTTTPKDSDEKNTGENHTDKKIVDNDIGEMEKDKGDQDQEGHW